MRVLLALRGHGTEVLLFLTGPGVAENRSFLLSLARAPRVLFLDDDLMLDSDLAARLSTALDEERCGFVGSAVIGLSYVDDIRPHEQAIEFWEGPVRPETVLPGSPTWERHRLHNAANIHHVARRLGIDRARGRKYKVAWVGGCVMYDRPALLDVGGFDFWPQLPPEHAGEDVLVQLRVMARYGGCGLIPSGAYHQELPTTVTDRRFDAPRRLTIVEGPGGRPGILD
ncbi:MAG: glycosyl transferase [Acidobacteria bacterium]|nr:MAG: glycosyl transferase [Acidobacteriota bacterium]